jgi:hypothetical protein
VINISDSNVTGASAVMPIWPDAFHAASGVLTPPKLVPCQQPLSTILMRARKDNQGHSEWMMPGCSV